MSNRLKNFIGLSIIFALVLVGISSLVFSRAFSDFAEPEREFSVSGEGEVVAKPDLAEFGFSVITQGGQDLGALQSQNSKKMNSVLDFVKSKGIEEKDIQTSGYNINPRYRRYSCPNPERGSSVCPPSEIVGYEVTQKVDVKVRDFSKLSSLLSGVVDNGANSVSDISFKVEDKEKLKEEARKKAIKKAKKKARNLAEDAGFEIGRLVSINEGFSTPYEAKVRTGGMGARASDSVSPDVEPGSQKITVDVNLRYEIE